MKKIIIFAALVIMLSSSCEMIYFAQQDKISYTNTHEGDTLDYEFAVFGLSRSNRKHHCDLFQAMRTNAPTIINKKDITVYQDDKPLKFDLYVSHPKKWDKVKKDTITLPEQSLVMISTKAKTAPGQTLAVVERNYPCPGDSIVVYIKYDDINTDSYSPGFFRKESVVRKMLPRAKDAKPTVDSVAMRRMMNLPDSIEDKVIKHMYDLYD